MNEMKMNMKSSIRLCDRWVLIVDLLNRLNSIKVGDELKEIKSCCI